MSAFHKIETPFKTESGLAASFYSTVDERIRSEVLDLPQVSIPASLENAVAKRKNEFRIGRLAAFAALAKLGAKSASNLEHQAYNAPLWPDGFNGSITHTAGLIGAAVVETEIYKSVGLDAEAFMNEKTAAKVARQILTENERKTFPRLATVLSISESEYLTAVFSAKEAIYKAYSKIYPERRSFQDVELKLSRTGFLYRWKNDSKEHDGQFYWSNTHVISLVLVR